MTSEEYESMVSCLDKSGLRHKFFKEYYSSERQPDLLTEMQNFLRINKVPFNDPQKKLRAKFASTVANLIKSIS